MKRRDFLKYLGVGALGLFVEKLLPVNILASKSKAASTDRTKRIFVSDLHMGSYQSLHPGDLGCPYGWLGEKRANMFADFLELLINNEPKLKELILNGDVLDDWNIPNSIQPKESLYERFNDIATASQNKRIIQNLEALADSGVTVNFTPGNHDMLLDQPTFNQILPKVNFKGIINKETGKYYPGLGVYASDDGIIKAEHGNRYCVFNAPNIKDVLNVGHTGPLGYFITRGVAEKALKSSKCKSLDELLTTPEALKLSTILANNLQVDPVTFNQQIDTLANTNAISDKLIQDIYQIKNKIISYKNKNNMPALIVDIYMLIIMLYCGLLLEDIVDILNIDHYVKDKDFKDVSDPYKGLWYDWPKIAYDTNFDSVLYSVAADALGLNAYAFTEYFWNYKEANTKIVIFGHSHKPLIHNKFQLIKSSQNTRSSNDIEPFYVDNGFLTRAENQLENYRLGLNASESSSDFGCFINSALHASENSSDLNTSRTSTSNSQESTHIYANSGSWIDSAKLCTFVETELVENKHYVRLLQYKEDGTIDKAQDDYEYYVNV